MNKPIQRLYLNAGQMKAGTTYLYKILDAHRQIFFSPEKELHYLSQRYGTVRLLSDNVRLRKARSMIRAEINSDRAIYRLQHIMQWSADYLRPVSTEGWYKDMFKGIRDDQWAADFSNLTATIPVAGLRQLEELTHQLRVTYCFRDPIQRAFSHAKFHLDFSGTNSNLADYEPEKLRELLLSPNILPQSETEQHVENLIEAYGPERVRLICCEDMWANPEKTTDAICRFLEIPPLEGEIPVEPINVGPSSKMTPELSELFEDVFASYREGNARIREKYADLVIS